MSPPPPVAIITPSNPLGLNIRIKDAIIKDATMLFTINIQSISNFRYLRDKDGTIIPTEVYVINVAIAAPRIPIIGMNRIFSAILTTDAVPRDIAIRSVRFAEVRT